MSDGMAHSGNYRVVGSGSAGVDVSPEKVGQVLLRLFRLFRVLRLSSKKGILKKAGLRVGFFASSLTILCPLCIIKLHRNFNFRSNSIAAMDKKEVVFMSTPHNSANPGDIAKTVLMPGDPLRAKYIAETYLTDPVCFNTVRNMLGYTGLYQGKRISVMGSGMGIPSMGIYSYELYHMYGVDNIIRIGSAGGIAEGVKLRDVVFAMSSCTDSNYGAQFRLPGTFAPTADFSLLEKAVQAARKLEVPHHVGTVVSSDLFYGDYADSLKDWKKMGALAVEMESAGLYMNAARAGKKALALFTVSDLPLTGESLSAEDRQLTFTQMMEIALEIAE